jgi:NADPH-dependent 2,4-dienoyl-CoA reductase/sulfur reductase-like enzyme/rhodanese-related sulfurtransferase
MKTIIVGGVAGGASAAARLRRLDENAEIIMLERGQHISFANCGLPYYVGGKIKDKADLTVQTPESFRGRFAVDVRVNSRVTNIDRKNKVVSILDSMTGKEYTEGYDKLVLSLGAEPIRPPIEGMNSPCVFTLRNIPDTLRIREYIENATKKLSAIVVGGGYIGVEMAENLKEAGCDVTIVELSDHLIAPLDDDMAAEVHNYIEEMGVRLVLKNGVSSIEHTEEGLVVQLQKGSLKADMLIMAVGVRPDSSLAKDAGLKLGVRGCIAVDSFMLTSDPDIYAVGDAVEVIDFMSGKPAFIPLAGPANKQGRIAADNIFGLKSEYTGTQGSAILKLFDMVIATTGMCERAAIAAGFDCDKQYIHSGAHAGYYPDAGSISLKVIFEKTSGKILGAQVIGFEGVDKRCDVLASAIRFGATASELINLELCYAPPFSHAKDPVNMAGLAIENILTGKISQVHWAEVQSMPIDGSFVLVDVREANEAEEEGMVDGAINIPLHELRDNLYRLDKEKPIYVYCFSGMRSYVANRILSGNGFKVFNIGGGWQRFKAIADAKRFTDE